MKLTRLELAELLPGSVDCDVCYERLVAYSALLRKANALVNLVSRRGDVEAEIARQIRRSLLPLRVVASAPISRWIDVGSGGGFPAIPVKIACPSIEMVMVESVGKKAEFLRKVVRDLGLSSCGVIATRAEDYAARLVESGSATFDVLSAKAVAPLCPMLEIASPLLGDGGRIVTFRPRSDFSDSVPAHLRDRFCRPAGLPGETIDSLAGQDIIVLEKTAN